MTDSQNAASGNSLHFHVDLWRSLGDSERDEVFSMTYTDPRRAEDAIDFWVDFNESIMELVIAEWDARDPDNDMALPDREVTQGRQETYHDGGMYEVVISHPARDGRQAGGTMRACDGEMVGAEDVVAKILAQLSGMRPEDIHVAEVMSDDGVPGFVGEVEVPANGLHGFKTGPVSQGGRFSAN
jgi:hypothetical protein